MNQHKQQGVALIAAIFLVVIIGTAVVLLSVLSLRNSQQTTQNLMQNRAQLATSAALEYAVQMLMEGSSCADTELNSAVSVPNYSDFLVSLSCLSHIYTQPSKDITILILTATAQYGNATDADYVWTQTDATIEL